MKSFSDYKIANISQKENTDISELESKIKSETGKDVVLIAYEGKEQVH